MLLIELQTISYDKQRLQKKFCSQPKNFLSLAKKFLIFSQKIFQLIDEPKNFRAQDKKFFISQPKNFLSLAKKFLSFIDERPHNHLKTRYDISSKYHASCLKIERSHLKIPFFVKRYIHYVLANSVQWDILRISMCILLRQIMDKLM